MLALLWWDAHGPGAGGPGGGPHWILLLGLTLPALVASCAAAARLRGARRRVERLRAELEAEREALLDLERFACVVSHDLKAPLLRTGFLLGYLEEDIEPALVGAPDAAAEVAGHLCRVRAQLERMNALIEGVLEYSTVGTGARSVESVDTRAAFDEIADGLQIRPDQLVLDASMPTLDTCRTPFVQVMGNIVGNAFKYHPEPARAVVTVRVTRLGERWRFSVADNGSGIDPRFHERIFEMFHRLEPAARVASSSGVGLSIVRRTVESLGGAVRVDSAPGRGATFRVDWPVTPAR